MSLINCESNLILTRSEICVISSATEKMKFGITDTKNYFQIVTSSTQDNAQLLPQMKSGLKKAINWNKYQSKVKMQEPNTYLD